MLAVKGVSSSGIRCRRHRQTFCALLKWSFPRLPHKKPALSCRLTSISVTQPKVHASTPYSTSTHFPPLTPSITSFGHALMTASTSFSARSTTYSPGLLSGGTVSIPPPPSSRLKPVTIGTFMKMFSGSGVHSVEID